MCIHLNLMIFTKIIRGFIRAKLAACINVLPNIKSIYHWNNEIVEDNEVLMMIKSESSKQQILIDTLVKMHPYDTPEVIIVPIENGFHGYLEWIHQSLN
ncbi:divalent-cation tolerance protein CutA [Proteus mirabilis]|uniref:divalent-cation tolerance protein CutA n=1 Tax=Proteus mirabilis TaxID=584 RepID=UPI0029FF55F9|nr:divalent-cation tolerance protein CutA [Proteus mirabilis]